MISRRRDDLLDDGHGALDGLILAVELLLASSLFLPVVIY